MLPIAGCVVAWWKSLKFREVGGSAIAFASTRASKANVYVIRFLAVLCPCNDGTFSRLRFSAAEFWKARRNRTRPDTSPPQRNPCGVAEVGARRSPWFLMNGGSKCLLKNHDALLSFSQRWRSALSRLLRLPHLRLAPWMVRSIPRVHVMGSASTLRASRPQPQSHVDDPFASLLLG